MGSSWTRHVRRVLLLGLCVATVAGTGPAAGAASAPASRWWRPACVSQSGHRITHTTDGDKGSFVAGPVSSRQRPHITAGRALANFESTYGRLSARDSAAVQVRFGRVTEGVEGPASGNVIGYVPQTRRIEAWLISDCRIVQPPRGYRRTGTKPGSAFSVVADTREPATLGGEFVWVDHGTTTTDIIGSDRDRPAPGSTRYRSVRWQIVGSSDHRRRLLLRYRTFPGFAIDHANVYQNRSRTTVSVILSTAAHARAAALFAGSPYAEIYADRQAFGDVLTHDPVGRYRYVPVTGRAALASAEVMPGVST